MNRCEKAKRMAAFALLILLMVTPASLASEEQDYISFELDGHDFGIVLDNEWIHNGVLYVPPDIAYRVGAGVPVWDEELKTLTFSAEGKTVTFAIDGSTCLDGVAVASAPRAIYKNGRAEFPLRFLVENLGGSLEWNTGERLVQMSMGRSYEYYNNEYYYFDPMSGPYQNEEMGLSLVVPEGSYMVALPRTDMLRIWMGFDPNLGDDQHYVEMMLTALPEADRIFGDDQPAEEIKKYLDDAAAMYGQDMLTQLITSPENLDQRLQKIEERDAMLMGEPCRLISWEEHGSREKDNTTREPYTFYYRLMPIIKDNVFYQVLLTSYNEPFDSKQEEIDGVLSSIKIDSPPCLREPYILPQNIDVSPLINLPEKQYESLQPIVDSGQFQSGMSFQDEPPEIQIRDGSEENMGSTQWLWLSAYNNSMDIQVELYRDNSYAGKGLNFQCWWMSRNYVPPVISQCQWSNKESAVRRFDYGGSGNHRYVASYIMEDAGSAECSYDRRMSYHSDLIVQIDNIVITINEKSDLPFSSKKALVYKLAGLLEKMQANS